MSLLDADVVVIRRARRLTGPALDATLLDGGGRTIGSVAAEGRGIVRLARAIGADALIGSRASVRDTAGAVLLTVRLRPGLRAALDVESPTGAIGGVQAQALDRSTFEMRDAGGVAVGTVAARGVRGWDVRFVDAAGAEVGRLTPRLAGALKEALAPSGNRELRLAGGSETVRALALGFSAVADRMLVDRGVDAGRGFGDL